jgi:hypothetical protein
MKHASTTVNRLTHSANFITEPLYRSDDGHIEWFHDEQRTHTARFRRNESDRCLCRLGSREVGRSVVAGFGSAGPARGRLNNLARAALILVTTAALASCASAGAASKTTKKAPVKKATSRKKVVKKPVTTKLPVTTPKPATTTSLAANTLPKLSADAKDVLDGYEAYLLAYVAGSREPERAAELYAKGMTGDALARLIEIARFDVANGQYWDGTRADIKGNPRVQTIGDTRAALRDCRSVAGVLRKRANNEPVAGTTGVDVDDLLVDLVKVDGRWVVTRTDRTNAEEGKATCVGTSSS